MTLKIISAEQIEFEGEVTLVSLPGEMGLFEVLNNHAALIAALTAGMSVMLMPKSRARVAAFGAVLPTSTTMWCQFAFINVKKRL